MCRVFLLHREQDFCNFCCKPSKIKFCIEGVSVGEICNTLLDSNCTIFTGINLSEAGIVAFKNILRNNNHRIERNSWNLYNICGWISVALYNIDTIWQSNIIRYLIQKKSNKATTMNYEFFAKKIPQDTENALYCNRFAAFLFTYSYPVI